MKNYRYESRITKQENEFYAIIVCLDLKTLDERVIYGYKGKFFKTIQNAEKSTQKYIQKIIDSRN